MSSSSNELRSVRIDPKERTGWTSERPLREGEEPRAPKPRTRRCRLLPLQERLAYRDDALLLVCGPDADARRAFVNRFDLDAKMMMDVASVRKQLQERASASRPADTGEDDETGAVAVADIDVDETLWKLLGSAITRRLQSGRPVVVLADGLTSEERQSIALLAGGKPTHLLLLDTPDSDRPQELAALRMLVRDADLGEDGYATCLSLTPGGMKQVRGLVFQNRSNRDD